MSILNPEHLLEQAERLVVPPPAGPPRQVDIRRAISSAYYSLFHSTLIAAADTVVGQVHRNTARYALVYRSIDHGALKSTCDIARQAQLPSSHRLYGPDGGFLPVIKDFATSALALRGRRLMADYDPMPRFRTADALFAVETARTALRKWNQAPAEQRSAFVWLLLFRPRDATR